jgi:hypothetical protein
MKLDPQQLWRKTPVMGRCVVILALILLAVRLALPYWIKDYVNRELCSSPQYKGSVAHVTVHLWRGAYRLKDVAIFKTGGQIKEPFFAARQIDLSLQWRELFHGAVVGSIRITEPEVNFVAGPTMEESQVGTNTSWISMVKSLFPVNFNRVEVDRGQIHFANHYSAPPVDVLLKNVQGVVTNLSNTPDLKAALPAGLVATGATGNGGGLRLDIRLAPKAPAPTFELTAQLTNVDMVALNDLFKAYGKFDVDRGLFSLYTSVAVKNGAYDGYVKVFFEDLKVFAWEKERHNNFVKVFWEAIVGTLATVLKNQPHDRLAAKVPISGTYGTNHVDVLSAIGSVLHNAFVRALIPRLDGPVTVNKVNNSDTKDSTQ